MSYFEELHHSSKAHKRKRAYKLVRPSRSLAPYSPEWRLNSSTLEPNQIREEMLKLESENGVAIVLKAVKLKCSDRMPGRG